MAIDPERFSELTNALQTALLLALRLDSDARDLRAAVQRAAAAAEALRPNGGAR